MTTKQLSLFDCYDRALPDEPTFTLLARDKSAPHMIRQWAYERERQITTGEAPESDREKVEEARNVATGMQVWRLANQGAWREPSAVQDKPTLEQDVLLDLITEIEAAVTTGALGGHTVRVHGIQVHFTITDMDSGKVHELSKAAGSFPVPKDAVLAPASQGQRPQVEQEDRQPATILIDGGKLPPEIRQAIERKLGITRGE